ncbi:hypothetical protein HA378_30585, partial [Escherichia coli]|nr:hypothetical protein [Escherichia coli]
MDSWVISNIKCCQIDNDEDNYHHHELVTTFNEAGVIRTCWHHDNHIRHSSAGWVAELAHK